MTATVYLDHNATAPLRPAARDAMAAALGVTGNASSVHAAGRDARRVIEDARDRVAALAGVDPQRVVFTSGGTEANNLALRGQHTARVLVSAVEHVSVREAVPIPETLPVDGDGIVDLVALDKTLGEIPGVALVAVMLANNETGVIQPINEVSAIVRNHGARLHVDAVQAAGRLPLEAISMAADTLALSAHKIGGPAGVGALVVGDGVVLEPILRGGGQERRRRAGTENVIGIAGFGAAAEVALAELDAADDLRRLRDRAEAALSSTPGVTVFGANVARLANTSCLTMPGVVAETQIMALDLDGVAVSAGAACSSGKVETSHVLTAMGIGAETAGEAIRISVGWDSTDADVDALIAAWRKLYAKLGQRRGQAA